LRVDGEIGKRRDAGDVGNREAPADVYVATNRIVDLKASVDGRRFRSAYSPKSS